MTNETQIPTTTEQKPIPFGARLRSSREALGLERKDAAIQLRLNEKVIIMMEKDRYPIDLPVTFIRGYLRSYAKLLQIPEYEVIKALEPIKPKPATSNSTPPTNKTYVPVTSSHYFMQLFTYLIIFTMIGLVGIWWYTHTNISLPVVVDNQMNTVPYNATNNSPVDPQAALPAATINPASAFPGENKTATPSNKITPKTKTASNTDDIGQQEEYSSNDNLEDTEITSDRDLFG